MFRTASTFRGKRRAGDQTQYAGVMSSAGYLSRVRFVVNAFRTPPWMSCSATLSRISRGRGSRRGEKTPARQESMLRAQHIVFAPQKKTPKKTGGFRRRGRAPLPLTSPGVEVVSRQLRQPVLRAVEDFDPPQHDGDGRDQRGHHKDTLQGSDSHYCTPLPSPARGSS